MAGFVLDIFIGFLVRWMILLWRDTVSRKWPKTTGTIVRCHFVRPGYGGNYVVLRYKYKRDYERYQGEIKEPFLYENYAEAFVRHHPGGGELTICVDPSSPARSFPIVDF